MPPLCGPDDRSPVAGLRRVPRKTGGERLLVTLTAGASRRYAAATLRAAGRAERRLGSEVVANRLDTCGRLEPWRRAHARWRGDLGAAVEDGYAGAAFTGDVRDCYGAITPAMVDRSLAASGADADAVREILGLLEACAEQGVRGLPAGPDASGVLANLVLSGVDDRLRATGLPHRRWVDDVVVFAPGRRGAVTALDAFRRALDAVGLEPNPRKTRVVVRRAGLARLASGSRISLGEPRGMG